MYRFHVPDPIRFQKHIKVTIERWWSAKKTVNVSYVVFWYQQAPVTSRAPLPQSEDNSPLYPEWVGDAKEFEIPVPALEVPVRKLGFEAETVEFIGWDCLHTKGGLLITTKGKEVKLTLPVPKAGTYRVEVKPMYKLLSGTLEMSINGGSPLGIEKYSPYREADGPFVNLGEVAAESQTIELTLSAAQAVPLHRIRLFRLERAEAI